MSEGSAAAKKHIRGRDAARMAIENNERQPVQIEPMLVDAATVPAATTDKRALVLTDKEFGHLAADRGTEKASPIAEAIPAQ